MKKRTDFIVLGIILFIVAGGLFYYTTIPFERTVQRQEVVTIEDIVIRERTVPRERLVRETENVVNYTDRTLADTAREFAIEDYIVVSEIILKPKDRIKFNISVTPGALALADYFEFLIVDLQNYNLWLQNRAYTAYYSTPSGGAERELSGFWTVPDDAPIQQYRIILSNRGYRYAKRITYEIVYQEATITQEERLVRVIEEVTETYEEVIPRQEIVTVTRQERFWYDQYRPISYILGVFGIIAMIVGFFTHAAPSKFKTAPKQKDTATQVKEPGGIPPCPICSSKVVPTHIIEDRKRIYKCTVCDHIFDLED